MIKSDRWKEVLKEATKQYKDINIVTVFTSINKPIDEKYMNKDTHTRTQGRVTGIKVLND